MGFVRKVLGPSSKYDQTLPYTYMAKIIVIEGMQDLDMQCYADTVCGLIDYLDEKGIPARDVELYAVYRTQEIQLDTKYCVDENACRADQEVIDVGQNDKSAEETGIAVES